MKEIPANTLSSTLMATTYTEHAQISLAPKPVSNFPVAWHHKLMNLEYETVFAIILVKEKSTLKSTIKISIQC